MSALLEMELTPEIKGEPRKFLDVLDEWADEMLRRVNSAPLEQMPGLLAIGLHGKRLLEEAHALGELEGFRTATNMASK